jgi:hypothetical protein
VEKDTHTHRGEQLEHNNEVTHKLLVRLKHAVISSDDKLVAQLLEELYVRYYPMFEKSILMTASSTRLPPDKIQDIIDETIDETFIRILRMVDKYKENNEGSRYGTNWMMSICRELTLQHIRRAYLPDLESSPGVAVNFHSNTAIEEIPAYTEVDTMGRVEGKEFSHPEATTETVVEAKPALPLLELHHALVEARAYEKIKNKKHRQVLESYLTTEATQGDLKQMAVVNTDHSVNNIIHRNLEKIFEHLPLEVQQKYGGSAKEAIKRKSDTQLQTATSKERIKEGLTTKRWQHYREVEKPQGKPPFSEQGLENIKRARRNTPREHQSKAAHRRWEKYREQQAQRTSTQDTPQPLASKEQTIVDFAKSPQKR